MQKVLVILGAGGLAKEARLYARAAGWDVLAFFEDGEDEKCVDGVPVVHKFMPEYYFLAAVGNPKDRRVLVRRAVEAGMVPCPPIVDPRACVLDENNSAGEGSIIAPGAILTTNVRIGKHCIINLGVTIGHDTELSDFVTIAPGANISGNVYVGFASSIGTGATVREKLTLGVESVLGMGATLTKDLPDGETWMSMAARKK